ncbi:DMT family transporter [Mycobacterium sp. OTB74]|uniref:DMT family transporter n=1 Tax=Mycobacterium sp. OTB74 TaxID=1853452 RepID=UPI00247511C0|nr:DMT family transporter [Mycobacterium sp. OTB74]MDH6244269.1 drug/metabolite transporter (DMT)-like permease [Mycobacterium sp. OTB74]
MITQGLVVVFALCAAVCAAVGIVVRQRATIDVPAEYGVSAVMISTLLRRRLWWAGTAAAVAGYVFQALALAHGSLIVVQPLLVSALLFALPLSARQAHRRVTRGEWLWAVVLTAGLSAFVMLARPGRFEQAAPLKELIAASSVCAVVIVGCVLLAVRMRAWQRAVLLAVGVGVLFGVVAVVTKIFMRVVEQRGLIGSLSTPAPYVLITLGVIATLLQQSAFHAGALQTSVPTMLVLEPVVAVLLGALVLGEGLDTNGPQAAALVVAIGGMVAATIALGRDEGAYETQVSQVEDHAAGR